MAAKGWTAPTWPEEYGGGGLGRKEAKILKEELARIHARPPLVSFGISMLGPALLKFGTEALRRQHLPPIVRGEIRWAQGYSEPNAGSDLASLQARCEDTGDHFVLNGRKLWIPNAGEAGIFLIMANAIPEAGYRGITSFIVERDFEGFQVGKKEDKLGIRASSTCELILENCTICPRRCEVNRLRRERGTCKVGATAEVASAGPHFGEEAPLVGELDFDLFDPETEESLLGEFGLDAAATRAVPSRASMERNEMPASPSSPPATAISSQRPAGPSPTSRSGPPWSSSSTMAAAEPGDDSEAALLWLSGAALERRRAGG